MKSFRALCEAPIVTDLIRRPSSHLPGNERRPSAMKRQRTEMDSPISFRTKYVSWKLAKNVRLISEVDNSLINIRSFLGKNYDSLSDVAPPFAWQGVRNVAYASVTGRSMTITFQRSPQLNLKTCP